MTDAFDVFELTIDDDLLDAIEQRAGEAVGGSIMVDAVAVSLMVHAYRERKLMRDFIDSQEPLGAEFAKVLEDNLEQLYKE